MDKRRLLGLFFALLFTSGSPVSAAQSGKTEVMILGVAHLVSKRDVYNSVFQDSPLSAKRQAQIADVLDHLARFRPTKVLIEQPMGDRKIEQQYQDFLSRRFTLGANEVYQFGFRLAAKARNRTIYPIDTFDPALIDESTPSGQRIMAYLKANFTAVKDPRTDTYIAHQNAIERSGTYLELLRYLNTDAAIDANASWYSVMDGMGRNADNAGSAYVSQWYARNAYIFSNILSVMHPGDRVVVIMGQGHEYLLRQFTQLNPNLVYVNPLEYLK